MEHDRPVSETSSVWAAREPLSTIPPLGEGRNVASSPKPEIVPIAATPDPEPELTAEVGDGPTTGHIDLD